MSGWREDLWSEDSPAAAVNWIAPDDPAEPVRAEVRVRYRHPAAPATITPQPNLRASVKFDESQRAITPGQTTVFYRGDEVIGGGWVVKTKQSVGRRQ